MEGRFALAYYSSTERERERREKGKKGENPIILYMAPFSLLMYSNTEIRGKKLSSSQVFPARSESKEGSFKIVVKLEKSPFYEVSHYVFAHCSAQIFIKGSKGFYVM